MNGSRIAPALVALLCITAIGVSATTLDSTLTTDPDEEIDPNYELLPIGQDDALEIQQEMEGTAGDPGDSDGSVPGEASEGDPTDDGDSDPEDHESSAESEGGDEGPSAGDDGAGSGDGTGAGTGPATPDLLDRLLAMLLALLRALVPLVAVLSLGALAVRHRARIAAAIASLVGSGDGVERSADPEETWPESAPTNPVDRAWVTMVRQADPPRPAVMTPAECAAAARDAGLDPAAVAAITDAFERVHYGGSPPSSEIDLAAEGLRGLQDADGGTPTGDGSHPGQRDEEGSR